MKRIHISPRANWQEKIKQQGFVYYKGYYNETAAYTFSAPEIDKIEAITQELFSRCLDVVQHVIDNDLWDEFFIPRKFADLIKWSWENDNPSLYGRFDLAVSSDCEQIKMLEFNADTPTSLLEASVIQWYWLQDFDDRKDQFNSLHEKLVAHLKVCKDYLNGDMKLWFACVNNSEEDFMTVKYLQDCADQAGVKNDFLYINDLSVQDTYLQTPFFTKSKEPVNNIFKLYPYEWMFHEAFQDELIAKRDHTLWIEPPYKAILSNKMLLVYLHKLFPNHPNILPAYYNDSSRFNGDYVQKPVLGREGANVTVVRNGSPVERTNGDYGYEGFVFQEYFPIPTFDGMTPVLGSWLIAGESAGMGIKETSGLVHGNMSQFIPHYFE